MLVALNSISVGREGFVQGRLCGGFAPHNLFIFSVYEFVSRYVTLDGLGCGFCPFHDDAHKSFGVNAEGNYWHCWAGCGGGSVIDFWKKWRETHGQDASFVATITDLAQILF